MGAAQSILSTALLNELSDFAADGGHHVDLGVIGFQVARGKKLQDAKENTCALDGKGYGAAQTGPHRHLMMFEATLSPKLLQPNWPLGLPRATRQAGARCQPQPA